MSLAVQGHEALRRLSRHLRMIHAAPRDPPCDPIVFPLVVARALRLPAVDAHLEVHRVPLHHLPRHVIGEGFPQRRDLPLLLLLVPREGDHLHCGKNFVAKGFAEL